MASLIRVRRPQSLPSLPQDSSLACWDFAGRYSIRGTAARFVCDRSRIRREWDWLHTLFLAGTAPKCFAREDTLYCMFLHCLRAGFRPRAGYTSIRPGDFCLHRDAGIASDLDKRGGRAVELALCFGDCRVREIPGEIGSRASWMVIGYQEVAEYKQTRPTRTISTIDCYYRDDCQGL